MRAVASEPLSPGEQPPELWRARRRPRRPPCQKCHGVRYIPYVKGLKWDDDLNASQLFEGAGLNPLNLEVRGSIPHRVEFAEARVCV